MKRYLRWILLIAIVILPAAICRAAEEVPAAAEHETLVKGPSESLITAVTTLIIFIALVIVLGKAAWGPIVTGLQKREAKIRGDIAEAEAARTRAEATLKQYNDQIAGAEGRIRDMLAAAQIDAEKLATTIRMQAQQEAEEAKEHAQRDIESSKDAAIREVYEQTANLATSVAEKILRRNLNADDQRDLVKQSLEQLNTVKV